MKKLLISVALIFLSSSINAAISQSGITNLKQLDKNGIIDLVSGNQLTGFISDGPFEGPIKQTYFKDGTYETTYDDRVYKGKWRAEGESYATPQGKKMCNKNNNATDWSCFYWYTGNKDGGTYAFIIAQGQIFHQYNEIKSVVQIKAEAKKEAQRKKVADAKKAEEKKKAAERKRVADAKKAEEKKKAAERKRVADAKKAEEKKKAAERKRVADAKKAEEKKKVAIEKKRIADAKRAEEKRVAEEKLKNALSLLPPKTKLQNAQDFLKDVEEFVSINPNEFDIMEVAMFKINTSSISEGILNDEQMKTLKIFKNSIKSSTTFLEFQKKRKDARNQKEVKKVTKLMDSIEGRIYYLQKENIKGSSSKLSITKTIKSAQSNLDNPISFSALQVLDEELFEFIDNLKTQEKNELEIKVELDILDQNTEKLKLYLAEKISSLTPEFMTLVVEKINALENTKEKTYSTKEIQLEALKKVNKEISSFISKTNIVTSQDIIAKQKQKEDKKKANELERKKIADAKKAEERKRKETKKAEERKRKEKANEGKHFFANMICSQGKTAAPILSREEISYFARLGIDPGNLEYINRIYPTKLCDCVQIKTNQSISLSRRKEVNRLYKINKKHPNLVSDQEADFFASLVVRCAREMENKMEYWMKGGRP
ncbi:hypothetical protein N8269_02225 [Candidatus Thioglobus sp.]|nr:hypothetical protein [Candidatus Thioglobus sp.]